MVVGYTSAVISSNYSLYIRKSFFAHVNSFNQSEIDKFSIPSLINRNTNDVVNATMAFNMSIRLAISAPASAIGGILKVVLDSKDSGTGNLNYTFPLIMGCGIGMLIVLFTVVLIIVLPRFKKNKVYMDGMNDVARENISGIRVIRAFNSQTYHDTKFNNINEKNKTNDFVLNATINSAFPFIQSIITFMTLGFYWVAAYMIYKGDATLTIIPTVIKYAMLSTIIIFSFIRIIMLFFFVPNGIISAKRINAVFDTKTKIVEKKVKPIRTRVSGVVEFKNVNLKFEGAKENVLSNINFKVNKGETLAIIGSTGTGKSRIINLIPRMMDATSGEILVDGVNIKDMGLIDLRNRIGFVPQKNFLFNTTINQNIEYGIINPKANKDNKKAIQKACQIACAAPFIEKISDKYEHLISQNATNLSGGQKQRLAIARAIVRNPEILIFDDSFSALDMATDKKVRDNIKKEMVGVTKIIVAQRIGTVLDADNIMVVDKGKVVGFGPHKKLLKTCKVYQEIALSQLSRKELYAANS
jgi:ATP-binding cassette subfamily B protein